MFVSIPRIFAGKVEDLPVFSGLFSSSAAVVQRCGQALPRRRCWPICCARSSGLWRFVHHPGRAAHGRWPRAVLPRNKVPLRGIHRMHGNCIRNQRAIPHFPRRTYSASCSAGAALSSSTICSGKRFSRIVASIMSWSTS